jgi:tetratricopeptide (TPR) repeat protein
LTQPLLSAALIVRDEELRLPACLESIVGVVDEIVVVDTGSSDASASLARAAGARVFEFPWTGDFSAARNHGLDRVRGRWVLYIDADERLEPVEPGLLQQMLANDRVLAYRPWLRPLRGSTAFREFRLWRNDPRIRFRNVIHEKVYPALVEVAQADGLAILNCELRLEHVGYDGDQAAKHRRNLPLLEAQLARDPSDIYNWHHLGHIRLALGEEAEGEAALRRALELALCEDPPHEHGRLAYSSLLTLLAARGDDTRQLADEALRRYPHDWALIALRAEARVRAGAWEAALEDLDRLVAVDPDGVLDAAAYDRALFGHRAQASRGLCLFRLGRYADAAEAYATAETELGGSEELRVKRELAAARARNH